MGSTVALKKTHNRTKDQWTRRQKLPDLSKRQKLRQRGREWGGRVNRKRGHGSSPANSTRQKGGPVNLKTER